MEKVLLPFLFLLVAVGLFFSYIRPTYDALQALGEQSIKLDEALQNASQLSDKMQKLRAEYLSISDIDRAKFKLLLPIEIDVVRTIIQLSNMLQRSGLVLTAFDIPSADTRINTTKPLEEQKEAKWQAFSIECSGSYQGLKTFLTQAERRLTLMEVTKIEIE